MTTFVFDLDGTLINSKKIIPDNVINIIKKISKDNLVIIASGRMHSSVLYILKKFLPFLINKSPIISYNGAYITNHKNKVIFSSTIDFSDSIKIIKTIKSNNIYVQTYIKDCLISDIEDERIKRYSEHAGVGYKIVDNLESHISTNSFSPLKILAVDENEKLIELQKLIIKKFNKINVVLSSKNYLDFMSKDSTKGNAVKFLSKYYNFDYQNAFIFGDSQNDISMLKISNNSFSVGNTLKEVMRAASKNALSSDEEGVYHAIKKFFYNDISSI